MKLRIDPLAWSITETAHKLGCNRDTVRSLIKRGDLTTTLVGRRRKVETVEIERYLSAGRGRKPQGKGKDVAQELRRPVRAEVETPGK